MHCNFSIKKMVSSQLSNLGKEIKEKFEGGGEKIRIIYNPDLLFYLTQLVLFL